MTQRESERERERESHSPELGKARMELAGQQDWRKKVI